SNRCYCRVTKPTFIDNTQLYTCDRTFDCPGNNNELCGGEYKKFLNWLERITVSKTDRTTEAVKNIQATTTMSVSMRDTTTTDFMHILTSDTSLAIVTQSTPKNIREISSSNSENANSAISTVMTETSTRERT
ncbi:Hypothetical predicted protein, partial [Mytilus galloprovincialis]